MHGYVLKDKNKNDITNYISWRDTRSINVIDNLDISKETGTSFKPNLPLVSINAIKITNEKQYNSIAYFYTLGSYVVNELIGDNITHITDAAPTGFYNLVTGDKVKAHFMIPLYKREIEMVGEYEGIKVYTPIGDHQASVYSTNNNDAYILNLGTAAQLSVISNDFITGDFESRPYFGNKTLCTVTNLIGGKTIRLNGYNLKETMIEDYNKAMKKLPKRKRIIVIGGTIKYHQDIIKEVLDKIGLPYQLQKEIDALDGINRLIKEKEAMSKKEIGVMLSEIPWSNFPVLAKKAGLDFFIIDLEHGGFDYKDLSSILMNAKLSGIKSIVRIPNNNRKEILRAMDMGANGLLLPMTNSKEEIIEVVKYAKYQPLGERGISTTRAHSLYNPGDILEYLEEANSKTFIYAQIETKEGLINVKEILEVDGVDGILVGPNDLSAQLGCLDDNNAEVIHSALKTCHKAASDLNKVSGVITTNRNYLKTAKSIKMEMFSIGSELSILKKGIRDIVIDNK